MKAAGYPAREAQVSLIVNGMSCTSCVGRAEDVLNTIPGVIEASVNLATETALIRILSGVTDAGSLARARALGFTIEDCRKLMALYEDETRASADVKHLAQEHLRQIEGKIKQLRTMQATLTDLVDNCAGDHRPDCPILRDLASS